MPSLRLGAFELIEPIRRGGMAEVWRGRHIAEDEPVAIKLVTEAWARTEQLREALRNEVRAMARLEHRAIVRVHDYGEVPDKVARRSGGRLSPQSPYLVMELADGGTLKGHHVASWDELVAVLSVLLHGLAHAHARGVVHRDIKPSNVLVSGAGSDMRFRLSDFGIAHALSRKSTDTSGPVSAGTAWFMAPEQILTLAQNEGPWTDLYSVGCLAHLLATHTLPFPGPDRERVYRAHCLSPLPQLLPKFDVPVEFEAWLHVMLAKRPRERFAFAADARRTLEALGGEMLAAVVAPDAGRRARKPPARTWTASSTNLDTVVVDRGVGVKRSAALEEARGAVTAIELSTEPHEPLTREMGERASGEVRRTAEQLRGTAVPRFSREDGPTATPELDRESLLGIGLGVYGLRVIPLTGRTEARKRLWSLLRQVWTDRSPRVVVLHGRAGHGKTRLAEWLVEHAAERGAAYSLWSGMGANPSLSAGLPRMIKRFVGEGFEREELRSRLADHPTRPGLDRLSEENQERLLDFLTPGAFAREVTAPAERFATVQPFLRVLGAERPVICVFDDAHHGREPISFAEHVIRLRDASLPLLVVLTVQQEALEDRPAQTEALDGLVSHARVDRIELGPLGETQHARLIESMLGLEKVLARRVAERTGGNPLFAIQLVGDLVQRGDLVASHRGFGMREGATLALPDDVHELWSGRIVRLLESIDERSRENARATLQLAAMLGHRVDLSELRAACVVAGVSPVEGLLDRLAMRRLALVGRRHFSFVHGMLSESLQRLAKEDGSWAQLHRACASMLRNRADSSGRAERIGRHYAAAGEGQLAADLLYTAGRERLAICDFDELHALAQLRDDGLRDAGIAESDPARSMGFLLRAEGAVNQARLDVTAAQIERALLGGSDVRVRAIATRLTARLELKRAQNDAAAAGYAEAIELMREVGDDVGRAHCVHGLGEAEKLLGRFSDSVRHHHEAIELFEACGMELDLIRSQMGLADVERRIGQLDEAVARLEKTIPVVRRLGNAHAVVVGLNTLGDIARARGQTEQAERIYRDCIVELEALASEEIVIPRLNLGLVQLDVVRSDVVRNDVVRNDVVRNDVAQPDGVRNDGARYESARETFLLAQRDLEGAKRRGYLVFAVAGLWVCELAAGRRLEAEVCARRIPELLEHSKVVDDDLAWMFEEAGRVALERREHAPARVAYEFALAQWRELDGAEKVSIIEAILDSF